MEGNFVVVAAFFETLVERPYPSVSPSILKRLGLVRVLFSFLSDGLLGSSRPSFSSRRVAASVLFEVNDVSFFGTFE